MGKDYHYHGQYQYVPSHPKMEITINQGASSSTSPTSPYATGPVRRPPATAPPPPPSYHEPQPAYNPMWWDRFPRRENRGMFRLALVELMLSTVIFAGGIWCYRDTPDYCPYYSAVWTSAIYIINALVGCAAAKMGNIKLYMAHLVLSLVSIMMCLISFGLAGRNWHLVGTYDHPGVDRSKAFCLLGTHDASRISYIFSHMDKYDFKKCLWELKVGVAVNSIQVVIAGLEILLNLLSAFLCLKRTCRI